MRGVAWRRGPHIGSHALQLPGADGARQRDLRTLTRARALTLHADLMDSARPLERVVTAILSPVRHESIPNRKQGIYGIH